MHFQNSQTHMHFLNKSYVKI